MKKIIAFSFVFILGTTLVFAQTKTYYSSQYGTMIVSISGNVAIATSGNTTLTFTYSQMKSGIPIYENTKYGSLLVSDLVVNYITCDGKLYDFYSSSNSTRDYSNFNNSYSRSYEICYTCHGIGNCPVCHGSGIYSNYGYSNRCSACNGTGKCWHCHGSKKQ